MPILRFFDHNSLRAAFLQFYASKSKVTHIPRFGIKFSTVWHFQSWNCSPIMQRKHGRKAKSDQNHWAIILQKFIFLHSYPAESKKILYTFSLGSYQLINTGMTVFREVRDRKKIPRSQPKWRFLVIFGSTF